MSKLFKTLLFIGVTAICLPVIPIFLTEAPEASTLIKIWVCMWFLVIWAGLSYMIWSE